MKHLNRSLIAASALAACVVLAPQAHSQPGPQDLDAVTQAFVAGMSASYTPAQFPWQFLKCDAGSPNCFGTNPDSPYGAPNFSPNAGNATVTKLKKTDALVLIMETPPAMRYFGVTPYLFTRYYPSHLPLNPMTPGFVPVFESLGDTVNADVMGTTGSATPGSHPDTQLSALVFTADAYTYTDAHNQLIAAGLPDVAINQVALPVDAVPLNMGSSSTSDTYTALLRMAYPQDPAKMADYISRAPVRVVTVTPSKMRKAQSLPTPISRQPGTGVYEPDNLQAARDSLVAELNARFAPAFSVKENAVSSAQTQNYVCISAGLPCNGDNPDAIYTRDVNNWVPSSRQDRILIVGVNHVSQGKTTYVSHSIVAALNNMGVQGVSDQWFTGTGLTMGQVSGPSDPRYATYSQLYAFTLSYDCQGDPVCKTIPEPSNNSVGIPYGQPVNITGRLYLDPQTHTRPSSKEVILHRAFVLTKAGG